VNPAKKDHNVTMNSANVADAIAGEPPTRSLVSIVLPAYNEELALGDDLRVIFDTMDRSPWPYEVIVVDDGSTDRTAAIAADFPRVRLISHQFNRGNGAARTTGLLAAHGDVVAFTDADGTYPNADFPRMLEALDGCDMVIGARTREAGTLRWLRTPAKMFIRQLASYMTGASIPDLNSGFRAMRRDAALKYISILPRTHSWVSTITIAMLSDGLIVRYIPIDYFPRKGRSSFHPLGDTYNYLSLVIRTVLYFDPLRVFLPLTAFLGAIGSLKLVYDIVTYQFHIAPSTQLVLLTTLNLLAIGLLSDLIVRRSRS